MMTKDQLFQLVEESDRNRIAAAELLEQINAELAKPDFDNDKVNAMQLEMDVIYHRMIDLLEQVKVSYSQLTGNNVVRDVNWGGEK